MKDKDYSINDVYKLLEEFRKETREIYVTKDEFMPVKGIAFGLVSIILITLLGAILTFFIRTNVFAK